MDEVGLIVRSISDRGLIHFELTGNIDARSLLNREVDVIGRDGALIRGVIGNLSRHLQTEEESQERISHRNLWIDIGAGSLPEVEKQGGRRRPRPACRRRTRNPCRRCPCTTGETILSGGRPAWPSKTGWKATATNHVSYGVPDYRRTRDFYIDLFGMRITFEDGLKCAPRPASTPAPPSTSSIRPG